MTIAFWCVLAAGLMPYVAALIAKSGPRFDNNNPRDWLAKQDGYRRRANAAQSNSFEAFPLFAVATIVAFLTHGPQARVDMFAMAFVAMRVVYLICYIADWALMRSIAWIASMIVVVLIFVAG